MSAQPGNFTPVIRAMQPSDLEAVISIEQRTYEFPWSRGIFSDCLMAEYISVVLDVDGMAIGYAIMSVAAAEAHILNLCIDNTARGQGLGRQLLDYLLGQADSMQVERLFLEVRPSNAVAIALYENSGFIRLGFRKDYYKAVEGREDALVLVRDMPA